MVKFAFYVSNMHVIKLIVYPLITLHGSVNMLNDCLFLFEQLPPKGTATTEAVHVNTNYCFTFIFSFFFAAYTNIYTLLPVASTPQNHQNNHSFSGIHSKGNFSPAVTFTKGDHFNCMPLICQCQGKNAILQSLKALALAVLQTGHHYLVVDVSKNYASLNM